MYRSERRSLFRFLAIYLLSTLILFTIGSAIFYTLEKHHLLDRQREAMKHEGEKIQHQLIRLHKSFEAKLPIRVKEPYKIALLDKDHNIIFSNFTPPKNIDLRQEYHLVDGHILYIKPVDPYYLGAAYLLLWTPVDRTAISHLQNMILLFMLGAGVFFLLLGYFLGRLFIAPMRESIETMNRFIQDTTHELNTPVSTILTNLELIQTLHKCDAQEEMQRIEIASKTLSRIYDDLTYLKLNHQYHRDIQPIDISKLLKERLSYFSVAITAKKLTLHTAIEESVILHIDQDDAIRLLDNLISNAIKYNRTGGSMEIRLNPEYLVIKDSGIGIAKRELTTIHKRFKRADSSEGGFGIGLDIVYQVVKTYGFDITIDSQRNTGTEVSVRWEK
ncbi:sensor histidine kinase [Sulfurovum sp. NBC37-1]|uniref:sensor histidine kinase n=1 Tax=Sulfurovum sp. (strain NBC37-1) TaxID=387093 RepID=UPI0001587D9D|nr:HAMP domain-containing sensor histidine kinase [Sulfurovum sp. NBC37-1]BAF72343.1 two-component sensor histidine kinase [Sulfurovum sp. NBC37-1]